MKKTFVVLSLFDGMSCGQIALMKLLSKKYSVKELENLHIIYYASEIEVASIKITMKNYPNTIQLGDVRTITKNSIPEKVDLIIGGSPCQDFSISGKKNGMGVTTLSQYLKLKNQKFQFQGQSYLFWEFVRLVKEFEPTYFLLENVDMLGKLKIWETIISQELGVVPIKINSSLVTAQNRGRSYWTNIPNVTIPQNKNILLKSVIPNSICGCGYRGVKNKYTNKYVPTFSARKDEKSNCLVTSYKGNTQKILLANGTIRDLTSQEAEKLQNVVKDYTKLNGVKESDRYKMLGNGWTVDVIEHIFSTMVI